MRALLLVVIESPWTGSTRENNEYLSRCVAYCVHKKASPYASHRMLTDVLDDTVQRQRAFGIVSGFAWRERADETWVFTDLGITQGMRDGIEHAKMIGHPIRYVSLNGL